MHIYTMADTFFAPEVKYSNFYKKISYFLQDTTM